MYPRAYATRLAGTSYSVRCVSPDQRLCSLRAIRAASGGVSVSPTAERRTSAQRQSGDTSRDFVRWALLPVARQSVGGVAGAVTGPRPNDGRWQNVGGRMMGSKWRRRLLDRSAPIVLPLARFPGRHGRPGRANLRNLRMSRRYGVGSAPGILGGIGVRFGGTNFLGAPGFAAAGAGVAAGAFL